LTTTGHDKCRRERDNVEPRHRKTGGAQKFAGQPLVASGRSCGRRVSWQSELARDAGGNHCRPIPDREDPVDRPPCRLRDNGLDRCDLLMKADGNRAVPPRIRNLVAAVGREHEFHAEPLGRLAKHPRLIPRRRRKQKDSSHVSCPVPVDSD
jgi:hypothetical protein